MASFSRKPRLLSGLLLCVTSFLSSAAWAQTSPTPLPYPGGTLGPETFNSLATTGTGTALPSGFGFVESGGDSTYTASDGSSGSGGVYSFGGNGLSDRALGTLRSGSVVPFIGVALRNDSGARITQFTVSYTGKQFRLGANNRAAGVVDRLDFQYSTRATEIAMPKPGDYVDVDALDFASPVTGQAASPVAGPVTASTALSATVTGVTIEPGATLFLRWNDIEIVGADDGLAIDDFTFSTPIAGTGPTPTATAAPTSTPVPAPATSGAIISEFRLAANGNSDDEFIELYNQTNANLDLTGWTLSDGTATVTIPGNKVIPPYGHLLLTGADYSLADFGGTGAAAGDIAYTVNFSTLATLSLRNVAGGLVDEVNPANLPSIDSKREFSYVRRMDSGVAQDTDVDINDFNIVDTTSTVGPGAATGVSSGLVRLGAPGPRNLSSPIALNNIFVASVPANPTVRTGMGNSGTLAVRRIITNRAGSGRAVTALRFHVVGLTAGDSGSAASDVRLISSTSSDGVNLPLTLLSPPNQPLGGGLNCSLNLSGLPSGGLLPGNSVTVELLFSVSKTGTYRFLLNAEPVTQLYTAPTLPDDDNMLLGNPSNAAVLNSTQTNKENLLVRHNAIALGYKKSLGEPLWVSWHLDNADIGNSGRTGNFHADTDLPADCRITDNDYSGSGYTRGHQCPSGDRTSTDALNNETFLLSNMVPQTADLNNGVWGDFEVYCRSLVTSGSELYIMSGGIGSIGTIAGGKVNIPASCWKVAVILPKGSGDLNRITSSTRVLSVIMPNTDNVTGPYTKFYTTVDDIESKTGLDLLANLPDNVENALEAKPSS